MVNLEQKRRGSCYSPPFTALPSCDNLWSRENHTRRELCTTRISDQLLPPSLRKQSFRLYPEEYLETKSKTRWSGLCGFTTFSLKPFLAIFLARKSLSKRFWKSTQRNDRFRIFALVFCRSHLSSPRRGYLEAPPACPEFSLGNKSSTTDTSPPVAIDIFMAISGRGITFLFLILQTVAYENPCLSAKALVLMPFLLRYESRFMATSLRICYPDMNTMSSNNIHIW